MSDNVFIFLLFHIIKQKKENRQQIVLNLKHYYLCQCNDRKMKIYFANFQETNCKLLSLKNNKLQLD